MWAAAVGGLLAAWCVSAVWGWGGDRGSLGMVLPLSLVVGGISAMVLGATLTIAAYVMLSAKHQVTIRVPAEISTLHAFITVSIFLVLKVLAFCFLCAMMQILTLILRCVTIFEIVVIPFEFINILIHLCS